MIQPPSAERFFCNQHGSLSSHRSCQTELSLCGPDWKVSQPTETFSPLFVSCLCCTCALCVLTLKWISLFFFFILSSSFCASCHAGFCLCVHIESFAATYQTSAGCSQQPNHRVSSHFFAVISSVSLQDDLLSPSVRSASLPLTSFCVCSFASTSRRPSVCLFF